MRISQLGLLRRAPKSLISKILHRKLSLSISLLFALLFISSASFSFEEKNSDIIDVELIDNKGDVLEARITNLSKKGKDIHLDRITIIGSKKEISQNSDKGSITEITWNEINMEGKKASLPSTYQSKIRATPLEKGDSFKAIGDYKGLVTAFNVLNANNKEVKEGIQKGSNNPSSNSSFSGSNSSRLSALASQRQAADKIDSTEIGEEVVTTTGCSPRIDYQLNKVFIQERTILGGTEVEGCRDSATSFKLQKDYDICPKVTDKKQKKIFTYFQYFYIDGNKSKSNIGSCQIDSTKTADLNITKSYEGCTDHIDYGANKAYERFKETYKDLNGDVILLNDCAIDYAKSYNIITDTNSCGIRHLFDKNYSILRKSSYYTKNKKKIVAQDCQDSSTTYAHKITTDTCTPVVKGNQVTIFSRKYIMVNSVRQYISACAPEVKSRTVQEENCTTTPYTHDFKAGFSYKNKNYFYYDLANSRVNVSNCVKSSESFKHLSDVSSCKAIDNDVTKTTTSYSKGYIQDNGNRIDITDCQAVAPSIPYPKIGTKWILESDLGKSAISATGISDNIYLGSKQGTERSIITKGAFVNDSKNIGESRLFNKFDISSYSTDGKCSAASSYSYNGNAIDLGYSNSSNISFSNRVDNISNSPACYNLCLHISYVGSTIDKCESMIRRCESGNNTLYYQRCTDYKCDLRKFVKKPIFRRGDNSQMIDQATILESKFTCGSNSLNNLINIIK